MATKVMKQIWEEMGLNLVEENDCGSRSVSESSCSSSNRSDDNVRG